jgi:hypothetical protein
MLLLQQDLISGSAAELLQPLLRHPRAYVYVCGSSNMAAGVSEAVSRLMGPEAMAACQQQGRCEAAVVEILLCLGVCTMVRHSMH